MPVAGATGAVVVLVAAGATVVTTVRAPVVPDVSVTRRLVVEILRLDVVVRFFVVDDAAVPEYMLTPVACTVPGDRSTPDTVAWCPRTSATRTWNGPGPAPLSTIQ